MNPAEPTRARTARFRLVKIGMLFATLVFLCGWLYLILMHGFWPAASRFDWEPKLEDAAAQKQYLDEVKPLLREKCVSCHGPGRRQGGLRLDNALLILNGGRSGAAVIPGDPEHSLLIERVSGTGDARMPKDGPQLTPKEIARLQRWVRAGAKSPAETEPIPPSKHWAFLPPRIAPPPQGAPGESQNPIDAFLESGRRTHALKPVPAMDRGRLLRRLTVDLTGVPPSLEELKSFLGDPSPEAYSRAVDRLLGSPQYGERWARHWMDVWRYSDEDGRRNDKGEIRDVEWGSVHLWRWRDWIIDSLNSDKGYDRMIREMLAADEIAPLEPSRLAATGFLVRNCFRPNRDLFLSGVVEHTAKAFLGLTLNCARCHDHKFDPISQVEYYRFRAFFEPMTLQESFPSQSGGTPIPVAFVQDALQETKTYVLDGGDPNRPMSSLSVTPGVPQVLDGVPIPEPQPPQGIQSSGRRTALADWLTNPHHPLTARVAVNHVWMRHFGQGLVTTPADFGMRGKVPSNPELLDWLALEFIRSGWSFKKLHRLIVTSRAYQMHSAAGPDWASSLQADPDNAFIWRHSSKRMEAEVLRDSLLHLAGRLDSTLGGPSQPVRNADASGRRSLYFRSARDEAIEFLRPFDPASLEECYERNCSVVPHQALALANSEFVWKQAEAIASQLPERGEAFVESAFLLTLCRVPNASERLDSLSFLAAQTGILSAVQGEPVRTARTYVVHALLNHNDFITLR